MNIFIEWIKEIVGQKGLHIAIDGKAIKSARDKVNNGNIPYILSGFLCDIGLSIGQIKVDDKSNEITAIPNLLDLIDVKGKIITIDAIGTQEEIANKIVIDVTCGSGAFMKNEEKAKELANLMAKIGNLAGKETVCIITDMNQPVGYAVGNTLEIIEVIEILKGNKMPKDIENIIIIKAKNKRQQAHILFS